MNPTGSWSRLTPVVMAVALAGCLGDGNVAAGLDFGPATQLAFQVVSAGQARQGFAVEVQIRDASGNLVTTAADQVTLELEDNPGLMIFHASETWLELVDHVTPAVLPQLPNLASNEVTGLTYDESAELVLGVTRDDNLAAYDPVTGEETIVGPNEVSPGNTVQLTGLAWQFAMPGAPPLALLAVGRDASELYDVDQSTGAVTSLGAMSLAGFIVNSGAQGLATDPTDGTMYAVVAAQLSLNGAQGIGNAPPIDNRRLVTVDVATQTLTDRGLLGEIGIADITFLPDGQLLGVTGDGAPNPSQLWLIDKTDASITLITALGNGSGGEAITWVPAQLSGTLTSAAVGGVATFSIQINAPANGYALSAMAAGLTQATSASFNITP